MSECVLLRGGLTCHVCEEGVNAHEQERQHCRPAYIHLQAAARTGTSSWQRILYYKLNLIAVVLQLKVNKAVVCSVNQK